jgi:hypothetical protein
MNEDDILTLLHIKQGREFDVHRARSLTLNGFVIEGANEQFVVTDKTNNLFNLIQSMTSAHKPRRVLMYN